MRVFRGREVEDDIEGVDMALPISEESICGMVGCV